MYDCINYGAFSDVSNCNINAFLDYSGNVDSTVKGVYSEEECLAAGGDLSAFEGFDFINTWIMLSGMPTLRHSVEIEVAGDIDLDGRLNGIDANIFRRYLAGRNDGMEYYLFEAGDFDGDGVLTSKDSLLMKRTLVG